MAPWRRLSDLSGTILSISSVEVSPNPVHSGQAPMGLLKLKSLGSAGGTTHPQPAHRSSEENVRGSNRVPSISTLLAVGLAVRLAVALDSTNTMICSGLRSSASSIDWRVETSIEGPIRNRSIAT